MTPTMSVDGDLADQPAALVEERGGDQVILVEDVGRLLLVEVDGDLVHRLHHRRQRGGGRGGEQAATGRAPTGR